MASSPDTWLGAPYPMFPWQRRILGSQQPPGHCLGSLELGLFMFGCGQQSWQPGAHLLAQGGCQQGELPGSWREEPSCEEHCFEEQNSEEQNCE